MMSSSETKEDGSVTIRESCIVDCNSNENPANANHKIVNIPHTSSLQSRILVNVSGLQGKEPMYSIPRLYANIHTHPIEDYYTEHESKNIWNTPDGYDLVRRIGRGKYSEVFEGLMMDSLDRPAGRVVVKVLKPVRKRKIKREIIVLKRLQDGPNIIKLLDTVKDPQSRSTALIFEFVSTIEFKEVLCRLTDRDARVYLFQLLVALNYCHSKGIIHRDIKPNNLIVEPSTCKLRVIDWGLAEFYSLGQQMNVRVASRSYKGPELLMDYHYYDYGLDMWSTGCMLAGILFKKEPFFKGADNIDQLTQICKIMGSQGLLDYAKKYNMRLSPSTIRAVGDYPAVDLRSLSTEKIPDDAMDLLERLLKYDHGERILPLEAIRHPYFSNVRTFYQDNYNVDWEAPNVEYALNAAVKSAEADLRLNKSPNYEIIKSPRCCKKEKKLLRDLDSSRYKHPLTPIQPSSGGMGVKGNIFMDMGNIFKDVVKGYEVLQSFH